jgi:phosphate acetyltransferase
MDIITAIRSKAKARLRTIALPEYNDTRVVEAARIIEKEKIAHVVVLDKGNIDPRERDRYIEEFFTMRQTKGVTKEGVSALFEDPLYYAAMMTREGKVDGFVAGACHTTADVARSAIHCIGMDERMNVASSCFIMVVPHCPFGEDGAFIFADCGIIPEPNARQLGCIAVSASELMKKVMQVVPRIAFLSYSTKGSAECKSTAKITDAVESVRQLSADLIVDGEIQVDAAIVPAVAKIKYPDSVLGGRANVLIFPNLEAGNISYKLVERLANARAIGPLILGLNKPCSDLSRGCSVEDVLDCVAVTSLRAL